MYVPQDDTAAVLLDMHSAIKSWRKVATYYGYPETYAATLSGIARQKPGCISERAELELRDKMGLFNDARPVEVMPCPSCGRIHYMDDCNGKDGELKYVPKPSPRSRRKLHRPVANPEDEARRLALGVTWQEVHRAGLDALEAQEEHKHNHD